MEPDFEKEFREIISYIPDLYDRVYFLLMIRDKPLDCQDICQKIIEDIAKDNERTRKP